MRGNVTIAKGDVPQRSAEGGTIYRVMSQRQRDPPRRTDRETFKRRNKRSGGLFSQGGGAFKGDILSELGEAMCMSKRWSPGERGGRGMINTCRKGFLQKKKGDLILPRFFSEGFLPCQGGTEVPLSDGKTLGV